MYGHNNTKRRSARRNGGNSTSNSGSSSGRNANSRNRQSGAKSQPTAKHRGVPAIEVVVLVDDHTMCKGADQVDWHIAHLYDCVEEGQSSDGYEVLHVKRVSTSVTQPSIIGVGTIVRFIYRKYRILFLLDESPSLAEIDPSSKSFIMNNVMTSIRSSAHTLLFGVQNGTTSVSESLSNWEPQLHVSVVAHRHWPTAKEQPSHPHTQTAEILRVLVHGCVINRKNYERKMQMIHNLVSSETSDMHADMVNRRKSELQRAPNVHGSPRRRTGGGLISGGRHQMVFGGSTSSSNTRNNNNFGDATPSTPGNILSNGLFVLGRMPEDACPLLILLTDGVQMTMPRSRVNGGDGIDVHMYDNLLTQFVKHGVTLDVIMLTGDVNEGASHMLHGSSFGKMADPEWLRFLAEYTGGVYVEQWLMNVPLRLLECERRRAEAVNIEDIEERNVELENCKSILDRVPRSFDWCLFCLDFMSRPSPISSATSFCDTIYEAHVRDLCVNEGLTMNTSVAHSVLDKAHPMYRLTKKRVSQSGTARKKGMDRHYVYDWPYPHRGPLPQVIRRREKLKEYELQSVSARHFIQCRAREGFRGVRIREQLNEASNLLLVAFAMQLRVQLHVLLEVVVSSTCIRSNSSSSSGSGTRRRFMVSEEFCRVEVFVTAPLEMIKHLRKNTVKTAPPSKNNGLGGLGGNSVVANVMSGGGSGSVGGDNVGATTANSGSTSNTTSSSSNSGSSSASKGKAAIDLSSKLLIAFAKRMRETDRGLHGISAVHATPDTTLPPTAQREFTQRSHQLWKFLGNISTGTLRRWFEMERFDAVYQVGLGPNMIHPYRTTATASTTKNSSSGSSTHHTSSVSRGHWGKATHIKVSIGATDTSSATSFVVDVAHPAATSLQKAFDHWCDLIVQNGCFVKFVTPPPANTPVRATAQPFVIVTLKWSTNCVATISVFFFDVSGSKRREFVNNLKSLVCNITLSEVVDDDTNGHEVSKPFAFFRQPLSDVLLRLPGVGMSSSSSKSDRGSEGRVAHSLTTRSMGGSSSGSGSGSAEEIVSSVDRTSPYAQGMQGNSVFMQPLSLGSSSGGSTTTAADHPNQPYASAYDGVLRPVGGMNVAGGRRYDVLSSFMRHHRWTWDTLIPHNTINSMFHMLRRVRFSEGFLLASSEKGSCTFTREIGVYHGKSSSLSSSVKANDVGGNVRPCLLQYCVRQSSKTALTTEVWMEPQVGLYRVNPDSFQNDQLDVDTSVVADRCTLMNDYHVFEAFTQWIYRVDLHIMASLCAFDRIRRDLPSPSELLLFAEQRLQPGMDTLLHRNLQNPQSATSYDDLQVLSDARLTALFPFSDTYVRAEGDYSSSNLSIRGGGNVTRYVPSAITALLEYGDAFPIMLPLPSNVNSSTHAYIHRTFTDSVRRLMRLELVKNRIFCHMDDTNRSVMVFCVLAPAYNMSLRCNDEHRSDNDGDEHADDGDEAAVKPSRIDVVLDSLLCRYKESLGGNTTEDGLFAVMFRCSREDISSPLDKMRVHTPSADTNGSLFHIMNDPPVMQNILTNAQALLVQPPPHNTTAAPTKSRMHKRQSSRATLVLEDATSVVGTPTLDTMLSMHENDGDKHHVSSVAWLYLQLMLSHRETFVRALYANLVLAEPCIPRELKGCWSWCSVFCGYVDGSSLSVPSFADLILCQHDITVSAVSADVLNERLQQNVICALRSRYAQIENSHTLFRKRGVDDDNTNSSDGKDTFPMFLRLDWASTIPEDGELHSPNKPFPFHTIRTDSVPNVIISYPSNQSSVLNVSENGSVSIPRMYLKIMFIVLDQVDRTVYTTSSSVSSSSLHLHRSSSRNAHLQSNNNNNINSDNNSGEENADGRTLLRARRSVSCRGSTRNLERVARVESQKTLVMPSRVAYDMKSTKLSLSRMMSDQLLIDLKRIPVRCITPPLVRLVCRQIESLSSDAFVTIERKFTFISEFRHIARERCVHELERSPMLPLLKVAMTSPMTYNIDRAVLRQYMPNATLEADCYELDLEQFNTASQHTVLPECVFLFTGHPMIAQSVSSSVGQDDGDSDTDTDDDDDDLEDSNKDKEEVLVPFWATLVLTPRKDGVIVRIHGDANDSGVLEIQRNINEALTLFERRVNQLCLLTELNNSRFCSDLLEPPATDDEEQASVADDMQKELDSDDSVGELAQVSKYERGEFSCQVVHELVLPLHDRLTPEMAKAGLRGRPLQPFIVNNRKNVYVYNSTIDKSRLFYMKIMDTSEDATVDDDGVPYLRLLVYGVDPPTKDLTQYFASIVREHLRMMILSCISQQMTKNRSFKLTHADHNFIRPPRSYPDRCVAYKLPTSVKDVYRFLLYLRQNLLQMQFLRRLSLTSDALDKARMSASRGRFHIPAELFGGTPVACDNCSSSNNSSGGATTNMGVDISLPAYDFALVYNNFSQPSKNLQETGLGMAAVYCSVFDAHGVGPLTCVETGAFGNSNCGDGALWSPSCDVQTCVSLGDVKDVELDPVWGGISSLLIAHPEFHENFLHPNDSDDNEENNNDTSAIPKPPPVVLETRRKQRRRRRKHGVAHNNERESQSESNSHDESGGWTVVLEVWAHGPDLKVDNILHRLAFSVRQALLEYHMESCVQSYVCSTHDTTTSVPRSVVSHVRTFHAHTLPHIIDIGATSIQSSDPTPALQHVDVALPLGGWSIGAVLSEVVTVIRYYAPSMPYIVYAAREPIVLKNPKPQKGDPWASIGKATVEATSSSDLCYDIVDDALLAEYSVDLNRGSLVFMGGFSVVSDTTKSSDKHLRMYDHITLHRDTRHSRQFSASPLTASEAEIASTDGENSTVSRMSTTSASDRASRPTLPRHLIVSGVVKQNRLSLQFYNWQVNTVNDVAADVGRIVTWHYRRRHFLDHVLHQKMGLFRHFPNGPPESVPIRRSYYQGCSEERAELEKPVSRLTYSLAHIDAPSSPTKSDKSNESGVADRNYHHASNTAPPPSSGSSSSFKKYRHVPSSRGRRRGDVPQPKAPPAALSMEQRRRYLTKVRSLGREEMALAPAQLPPPRFARGHASEVNVKKSGGGLPPHPQSGRSANNNDIVVAKEPTPPTRSGSSGQEHGAYSFESTYALVANDRSDVCEGVYRRLKLRRRVTQLHETPHPNVDSDDCVKLDVARSSVLKLAFSNSLRGLWLTQQREAANAEANDPLCSHVGRMKGLLSSHVVRSEHRIRIKSIFNLWEHVVADFTSSSSSLYSSRRRNSLRRRSGSDDSVGKRKTLTVAEMNELCYYARVIQAARVPLMFNEARWSLFESLAPKISPLSPLKVNQALWSPPAVPVAVVPPPSLESSPLSLGAAMLSDDVHARCITATAPSLHTRDDSSSSSSGDDDDDGDDDGGVKNRGKHDATYASLFSNLVGDDYSVVMRDFLNDYAQFLCKLLDAHHVQLIPSEAATDAQPTARRPKLHERKTSLKLSQMSTSASDSSLAKRLASSSSTSSSLHVSDSSSSSASFSKTPELNAMQPPGRLRVDAASQVIDPVQQEALTHRTYLVKVVWGFTLLIELRFRDVFACSNLYVMGRSGAVDSLSADPTSGLDINIAHRDNGVDRGSTVTPQHQLSLHALHRGAPRARSMSIERRVQEEDERVGTLFVSALVETANSLHMNSFVYDFHLRQFSRFLTRAYSDANSSDVDFMETLMAFVRFFPYPPAYARNHLLQDVKSIPVGLVPLDDDSGRCAEHRFFDYVFNRAAKYNLHTLPTPTNAKLSSKSLVAISATGDFNDLVVDQVDDSRQLFIWIAHVHDPSHTQVQASNQQIPSSGDHMTLELEYFVARIDLTNETPYLTPHKTMAEQRGANMVENVSMDFGLLDDDTDEWTELTQYLLENVKPLAATCLEQAFNRALVHFQRDEAWSMFCRDDFDARHISKNILDEMYCAFRSLTFRRDIAVIDPSLSTLSTLCVPRQALSGSVETHMTPVWQTLVERFRTVYRGLVREFEIDNELHVLILHESSKDNMLEMIIDHDAIAAQDVSRCMRVYACQRIVSPHSVGGDIECDMITKFVNVVSFCVWTTLIVIPPKPGAV